MNKKCYNEFMIKIPQLSLPDLTHLQIDFEEITRLNQRMISSINWDAINNVVQAQTDVLLRASQMIEPTINIMQMMQQEADRAAQLVSPMLDLATREAERIHNLFECFTPAFIGLNMIETEEEFVEEFSKQREDEPQSDSSFKIPQLKSWEGLVIKFADDEHVEISFPGIRMDFKVHYRILGFEDKRNNTPDKNWEFLMGLALLGGQVTWSDRKLSSDHVKKRKQFVKNKLAAFFGLDEDPFHKYTKKRGYQLKFILMPVNGGYGL